MELRFAIAALAIGVPLVIFNRSVGAFLTVNNRLEAFNFMNARERAIGMGTCFTVAGILTLLHYWFG